MSPSTWAGTLTAVFTLATAVVVFLGARATLRATRKVNERMGLVENGVTKVEDGITGIHQAVNSRLDAMLARQELMIEALRSAGLAVPPAVPLSEVGGSGDHG